MMLSVVGEEGGEKEIGSLKGRKRSKEGRGFSGDKIGKKEKNRKKKKEKKEKLLSCRFELKKIQRC